MRLDKVEIVNFRGFERFALELHPEFTLLIGPNGAGKTALIDALAIAARHLVPEAVGPEIQPGDLRRVLVDQSGLPTLEALQPAVVRAAGDIGGRRTTWTDRRTLAGATVEHSSKLTSWWNEAVWKSARGDALDLPVLAAFRASRRWEDVRPAVEVDEPAPRLAAWQAWWRPTVDFQALVTWFRRQTYADIQQGTQLPQLAGVRRAVVGCLGDVADLHYDIRAEELRVRLRDGRVLPLGLLSDGYRSVVAMVADLAWRATTLNPHFGSEAAERAAGIVLIDEIDLHLHPAWQRRVIGDLRRTFPRFQFVATTHSPQVLSTAQPDWVRVIGRGEEAMRVDHVTGRDSNALLEDVFGVSERPDDTRAQLDELFALIDRRDLDTARVHLARLRSVLGPDDADLVRAGWLLEVEAS